MVFVFFGYDKISNGHFLIPNTPHFIGLFLGKDNEENKPYTGRYFKKQEVMSFWATQSPMKQWSRNLI